MKWIIDPEIDMVSTLGRYGRYLEDDYRMAIEALFVPDNFDEYSENTGRRFIIVGGNERPGIISKSVFLCLKLAGPSSVAVSVQNIEEMIFVENVFKNHAGDIDVKLFHAHGDQLKLNEEWREVLENATDIVVYGNAKENAAWRDYETVDRHVWEHKDSFSFGVVRSQNLNMHLINEICFDFFSYYGNGRFAPRFYFIIGKYNKKLLQKFSETMTANYGNLITEYRNKLPLTRKSDLTRTIIDSTYFAKFLRVDVLTNADKPTTLYGDMRLIFVDSMDEVEDFIERWKNEIGTISINWADDTDLIEFIDDYMIPRVCEIGSMQFPDFFEQFDALDDFNIYVDDIDEYENNYWVKLDEEEDD